MSKSVISFLLDREYAGRVTLFHPPLVIGEGILRLQIRSRLFHLFILLFLRTLRVQMLTFSKIISMIFLSSLPRTHVFILKIVSLSCFPNYLRYHGVLFVFQRPDVSLTIVNLHGGHRLISSLTDPSASGVVVLVHQKHRKRIIKIHHVSDRLLAVDIRYGIKIIRVISVYIPHVGYSWQDFTTVFDDLQVTSI